jgi:hypothetical protein
MNQTLIAPLSNNILGAYTSLVRIINTQNPTEFKVKKYDGTVGPVSIAELLSYQIGWGSLLIYWYETGLQHDTFQIPGEGFTEWKYNDIAHHFYKKYDHYSLEELLVQFKEIVTTIVTIVEKEHTTGNLETLGIWKWCTLKSGKQWPLSKWIQINTVAPYKRCYTIIKKN